MSVRIEELHAPAPSLSLLAILGLASTTAAMLLRWWQRPAPLKMSDDWLSEHARFESHRGWQ